MLMSVPYDDVSANNDDSCFCCCHSKGVSIYDSYPIQMRLNLTFNDAGVGKCVLLNRTNYTAIVRNHSRSSNTGTSNSSYGSADGGRKKDRNRDNDKIDPYSPDLVNQVFIWDDLLKKSIFKLIFLYPVDKVFLTRLYLVILSHKEIQIFTFTNPPRRLFDSHILKTDNSHTTENIDFRLFKSIGLLAYESVNKSGQVYISRLDYDSIICSSSSSSGISSSSSSKGGSDYIPTNIIKAHKNPIQLIKLSPHGKYVATCSTKGTIVRVFSTINGLLINEYRRGLDSATIYNMKFSQDDRFLCVISNKQTLHVFQIEDGVSGGENNKNIGHNHFKRSVCSIKLFNPLIRDNKESFRSNDMCEIIWNEYGEHENAKWRDNVKYGIILVWYKYRIWIRYIITYNEISTKQFAIVKESWRQL